MRHRGEHRAGVGRDAASGCSWSGRRVDPEETEELETLMHHHVMGRDDAGEGVMAFLESR